MSLKYTKAEYRICTCRVPDEYAKGNGGVPIMWVTKGNSRVLIMYTKVTCMVQSTNAKGNCRVPSKYPKGTRSVSAVHT